MRKEYIMTDKITIAHCVPNVGTKTKVFTGTLKPENEQMASEVTEEPIKKPDEGNLYPHLKLIK